MAEIVQLRKELSLAEYEGMKRIKLFDDEELKKIKKTRERFEYKLEKQSKDLKDFCEYIKYERSLLGIINERRVIRHIKEKKAIERLVAVKIQGLYSKTLARFPGDLRLWDSFIKFCRGTHFTSEIPSIHDRMLQLHIGKPEVWLKAIMWEYTETSIMVRVKHLLTNALRLHPKDKELNKAFIQIELTEAQTIVESDEKTDEQKEKEIEISVSHCEQVYKNFKAADLDYSIEMLNLTLLFPFAHAFSRKILMDIYSDYKNHPKVWNCFAQSELSGITLYDVSESAVGIVRGPRTLRMNIANCIQVYEFAVKQVPCQEMYTFYIDAVLELNEDMKNEKKLRRQALANAFKSAHEGDYMSDKHYLIYLQLLLEADSINTGKMDEIFTKALKNNSIDVWKLRLMYAMKHESKEKLPQLFETVTKNVTFDDLLEIYKLFFSFLSTNTDHAAIEQFLTTAIKHENRSIASHFKPEYIEWIALNNNLLEARKMYKEFTLNSFPCLGLHRKMISLECANVPINVTEVRKCYEYAVQLFGFKEVSIWIDFIRFERNHGSPKTSSNLYQRAKATIKDEDAVQKFIELHSLMQMEDSMDES